MDKFIMLLLSLNLFCNSKNVDSSDSGIINLLENDSLSHFEIKGGQADYQLKDGILTGTAKMGIPNSFLTTKKKYEDFVLSFSVKVDSSLNSGVQIRSEIIEDNQYEMLKGYQVEIDPSPRAWSGGIYEERGRGWIGNLANNPKGRAAFKLGEWNHYHIEATGYMIRVWVNEVNTVNLLDDQYSDGFIGFQVHSINDEAQVGAKVQWKDVKLVPDPMFVRASDGYSDTHEINLLANQLSQFEKEQGWKLYDIRRDPIPHEEMPNWSILDDCLCAQSKEVLDLTIPRESAEFEVKFEYKIKKGGYALFNYEQDPNGSETFHFVLADDLNLPEGTDNDRKAGSTAGHAAKNLSNPGKSKVLRSHDQWSQVRILMTEEKLQHWLNHNLVLEMEKNFAYKVPYKRMFKFKPNAMELCVRSIKYRSLD